MKTRTPRNTEPRPVTADTDDPHAHSLADPYSVTMLTRAVEAYERQREQDDDFNHGWAA
jgi:hypothetical protein